MSEFKDYSHLVRVAAVFALGAVAFVAIRAAVIPESFGQYGPFRGEALRELTSPPPVYAGHEACEVCHPDVAEAKSKGVHAHVNCESCHGPQAKHAEDPGTVKPALPDVATLCVRCHARNAAKPSAFPQVDANEHAQGQKCNSCHQPHNPGFDAGGKK
jgi:hypothetical protein